VTQPRARAARHCQPTSAALVGGVQASPVVAPDETGWRVGGRRAWLWAFAGDGVTVYRIAAGRGFDDATAVLGADYAGVLERDGWAPYRKFTHATHQSCLAHLLRRRDELLGEAQRGQAKTPHALRRLLQQALAVRDAHDAGRLDTADAAVWAERLGAAVDKVIAGRTTYPPNRRLLDHLGRERPALFTFSADLGSRRPTGAPSTPSAPRSSAARPGAATPPGTGREPGRSSPACCAPPPSSTTTRSRCWPGCCARLAPPWPTSPSPPQRGAHKLNPVTNYGRPSGGLRRNRF
jgi:transposase IS66 family protein